MAQHDKNDPLLPLIVALESAQAGQRMSKIINPVRRFDETDEQALARLVAERTALANLLRKLEVPHDQFDPTYRNSNVIDDLLKRLYRKPTKQGI